MDQPPQPAPENHSPAAPATRTPRIPATRTRDTEADAWPRGTTYPVPDDMPPGYTPPEGLGIMVGIEGGPPAMAH